MAAGNESFCGIFNFGITEGVPRADAPGPTDPELVNIELEVKFIDMERYGCPEDGVFAECGRKHSQLIHYYDPEYVINNTKGVVLEILDYQRVPLEPPVIDAIADCAFRLALAMRDHGVNSTMLKVEIEAIVVNGFPDRVNNDHVELEDDAEEHMTTEAGGGVSDNDDADADYDDDDEDWQMMLEEEAAEYLEMEVVVEAGEICSICLAELTVGSEAACMPCSHMFHRSCILPWLTKVQSCPYCRFDLNEL